MRIMPFASDSKLCSGLKIIFLAIGMLLSQAALAIDILPASVNPSLIARQVPPPVQPAGVASITVPSFTPQAATAVAAGTAFTLNRLNVTGSSVYGNTQLENMFRDYIGKRVTLADLQQMADIITVRYRSDGYVLTKAIVPAQNITCGVVTIRVIEGYVDKVYIEGDPSSARLQLEKYADKITQARPLNIAELERYVLLANDIPGLNVHAVLSPAKMPGDELAPSELVPGAAFLTLVTSFHRASGYFTFDNRGTRYLGPNEYSFGGNLNSIFRSGDITGFQSLITTKTHELQFLKLYHQTPICSNGMTLNIAGSVTHTEPGFLLEPLDVVGRSNFAAMGISYPVIRARSQSLYAIAGVDESGTKSSALGFQLYNDRLRSIRVGANYNLADSWQGINQLGGLVSQGIPALGASPNGDEDLSRIGGRVDYFKVNLNASRLQGLGHNFSIFVAAQGQYTPDALLVTEQFTYGGAQYGEAYDPATLSGDKGIDAKAELRYDIQPSIIIPQWVEIFGFYDVGKVWFNDFVGIKPDVSAASAGIGLRTTLTDFLSGSVVIAKPLTLVPPTEGNKDPRIFFSVTLSGDTPSTTVAIPLPPLPPEAALCPGTGLRPICPPQPVIVAQRAPVATTTRTTMAMTAPQATTETPQYQGLTAINNSAPQANTRFNSTYAANSPRYQGITTFNNTAPQSSNRPVTMANSAPSTIGRDYVLQLSSGRDLADLKQFAASHNLSNVQFIHTQYDGGNWYILAYGQYDSVHSAELAKQQLPAALAQLHPWVRQIG